MFYHNGKVRAAGDLVAIGNKATSGDKSKFCASVKQLVIGAVPDRGGRTDTASAAAASTGHAHHHRNCGHKGDKGGAKKSRRN